MTQYSTKDLRTTFEAGTALATVNARLLNEYVGGQPADEKGLRAYVVHHLGLEGEEAEKAVKRILVEEVGEKDVTPEQGEIAEKQTYGLSVVRKDEFGPYVGDWQIKAAIKAVCTRLDLFKTAGKIGLKGDVAELGEVRSFGTSIKNGSPFHIHFIDQATGQPPKVGYLRLRGKVHTPQGAMSIVGDHETIPAGTEFSFALRVLNKRVKEADLVQIFSYLGTAGLGSARSLQYGRFEIMKLDVDMNVKKEK